MKHILFVYGIVLVIMTFSSCKQNELGPAEKDGVAPGPVSNLSVLNESGSATITFTAPSDLDLLYVKGRYTTKDGIVRETKVSRYNNEITLDGFADTDAYKVTLIAVDKGENESKPVDIIVNPLEPPYKIAYKDLKIVKDFGGLKISFENAKSTSLAVIVLTDDTLKNFVPVNTHYTNLKDVSFSVRGFASVERKFGIVVRDRWGNKSDTLDVKLTPLFETRLDRTKMKGLILPTDASTMQYGGNYNGLFDNIITSTAANTHYHTSDGNVLPLWFTFDMGVTAQLSRLIYYFRPDTYWNGHNPKKVEIWGSNNPNLNGSFDESWVLMTTFTSVKPSGLPLGQNTQDDVAAAQAGQTIVFPLDVPKVRYIRFKTLTNWGNTTYVNVHEVQVFGDPE